MSRPIALFVLNRLEQLHAIAVKENLPTENLKAAMSDMGRVLEEKQPDPVVIVCTREQLISGETGKQVLERLRSAA